LVCPILVQYTFEGFYHRVQSDVVLGTAELILDVVAVDYERAKAAVSDQIFDPKQPLQRHFVYHSTGPFDVGEFQVMPKRQQYPGWLIDGSDSCTLKPVPKSRTRHTTTVFERQFMNEFEALRRPEVDDFWTIIQRQFPL
jgi:hypothetical protein